MDPIEKPEKCDAAKNPQSGHPDFWAYWNGSYVRLSELAISIFDSGFLQGATVVEQLRTFSGQPFRVAEHVKRLMRSLEITGISPALTADDFSEIIHAVAEKNYSLVDSQDDLAIGIWVTPGVPLRYQNIASVAFQTNGGGTETLRALPTICCYAHPIDFQNWPTIHTDGQDLVTSDVRQVASWPSELKCRSRMHYFLADRQAREHDPVAAALLLDQDGFVNETSKANIVAFIAGEGIVSPRKHKVLPGISLAMLEELSAKCAIPFGYRDMMPFELLTAQEVMLCSTAACVWHVARIDGQMIGDGKPGAICQQLLKEWGYYVGVDIAQQAEQFAKR